ncbi:MAG: hypothetical protein R3240_08780, partial [Gammaproteobacteria bacterium]|nr:hypothetical protein [Gammaproteobacteria bacterium]
MKNLSYLVLFLFSVSAFAIESNSSIPMYEKGLSTYYVKGFIEGFGGSEFMVDTGSGYSTINEQTLEVLKE